jgi:phage recombination protein Bet
MNAVVEFVEKSLPEPVARRGISEAQWRTLAQNLYPGAASQSVLMVWDYCIARKLDPLKKPCHIVPMRVKDQHGDYQWRDVVMPGIYEYRTTATRTGLYLGHSKPEYGPEIEFGGVKAPEWCDITIYRWNEAARMKTEYPVRAIFSEVAATKKDGNVNERWFKAPVQMLTKCAEAAGLREAFPDELGGTHTADEMDGQIVDAPSSMSANPRDGLEVVEPEKVDALVARVTDILAADVEETEHADMVFAVHQEVCSDADLYTALQDALKARGIIKPAGWKALVAMGSKQYQERNLEGRR